MKTAPLLPIAWVALASALLAGCAAPQPAAQQLPAQPPQPVVRVVDTACSWVRVITVSADDTTETKRQVIAHDLAVMKNCPDNSSPDSGGQDNGDSDSSTPSGGE